MSPPKTTELIRVLERRWDVLEAVVAKPSTKPELERTLEISRSTVDRAVTELVKQDVIARQSSGAYSVTAFGSCVVRLWKLTTKSLAGLCRVHNSGLSLLPTEYEIELVFADAEIITAAPHAPDEPLQVICDELADTSYLRGFTPVVLRDYVDICAQQISIGELATELIVTSDVRECLSNQYATAFTETAKSERARFYELENGPSFGLAIFGEENNLSVCLLCYGTGGLQGIVRSDAQIAVTWAKQVHDDLLAQATQINPT